MRDICGSITYLYFIINLIDKYICVLGVLFTTLAIIGQCISLDHCVALLVSRSECWSISQSARV